MIHLIGFFCLLAGIAVGWLLRSEDVWARDEIIHEQNLDIDYALGLDHTRQGI